MKQKIRHIFRKFGYEIVRSTPNQIGKNPLADIVKFLHNDHPVIFDVGANVGQSIQKFRAQIPNCTIHSFEPSPTTFETLGQQASELMDVHLWNHALGSVPGRMTFLENSHSEMSSFLPLSNLGWGSVTKETLVEVKTIDQFCHDENVGRIDVLKSDTQGFRS